MKTGRGAILALTLWFIVGSTAILMPGGYLPEYVTLEDGTKALIHRHERRLYLQNQSLGGTFGKAMIYQNSSGHLIAQLDLVGMRGYFSVPAPANEEQKRTWQEIFSS